MKKIIPVDFKIHESCVFFIYMKSWFLWEIQFVGKDAYRIYRKSNDSSELESLMNILYMVARGCDQKNVFLHVFKRDFGLHASFIWRIDEYIAPKLGRQAICASVWLHGNSQNLRKNGVVFLFSLDQSTQLSGNSTFYILIGTQPLNAYWRIFEAFFSLSSLKFY